MHINRNLPLLTTIILFTLGISVYANQGAERLPNQWFENLELPSYARYLNGYKICLDPGHGGQGHIPDYKRGPTGLREAEINLKVAFYLRELLERAEAIVILTRKDDTYVSLAKRSQISNENNADFFLSIHHNGLDNNPEVNYTSTWYHGDADESRPSLDLARYIQQGVSDALRLEKSPSTGLYSDKLVVASGFGVLRLTECPAVVCEASFYTNPDEEARLREDDYLKNEAYGYFLGIARYIEAGFPRGDLITPAHKSVIQTKTPMILLQVHDGIHERGAWILKRQQIFSNAIQVKINDVLFPFQYDRETDIITVQIENPLSNGIQYVQTEIVNYYGNHSLPNPQQFKVAPPAANIELQAWTDTIPFDGRSYVGIDVTAKDNDGLPIADGERINAQTTLGTLSNKTGLTFGGRTAFYLIAPKKQGTAIIQVSYGKARNSYRINFSDVSFGIIQGQVINASSDSPIPQVNLEINPETKAQTDTEGHYFIKIQPDLQDELDSTIHLSKVGYYPAKQRIQVRPNKATVVNQQLNAIADGVFAETLLVLDTKTDKAKTLQLINTLKQMLELAGAKVYDLQPLGKNQSTKNRIENVNKIRDEGFYLQINHSQFVNGQQMVIAAHNRGNQDTETFQKRILEQFNKNLYETPITTIQDRETPIIQQTNKMAMTLEIRSLDHPNSSVIQEAKAIFVGIWSYLKQETKIEADKLERFMVYYNNKRVE